MHLAPNWKVVIRKAWSIRMMAAAAVLSGLEQILPLFPDLFPDFVGWPLALVSFLLVVGACVARLIAQKGVTTNA